MLIMKNNCKILSLSLFIAISILFLSCNRKSSGSDSIGPILNCDFPPSQSNFGYSYYRVGNQYTEPSYSNGNIVCNFLSTEPFTTKIVIIDQNIGLNTLLQVRAIGNVPVFNKKILYTDSKLGSSSMYDFENSISRVFETGKNYFCTEFNFSPDGSKFVYKAENVNDLSKSYIFIRDTSLFMHDSIKYFDYGLETWTKITWMNDHTLLYAYQNDKEETGIKQFDLNTRNIEFVYKTKIINNKSQIRSIIYSTQLNCIFSAMVTIFTRLVQEILIFKKLNHPAIALNIAL